MLKTSISNWLRIFMNGAMNNARAMVDKIDDFLVLIGLHQSLLSSYLFAIVMHKLIHWIQDEAIWCMLLANEDVLLDISREGLRASWTYRINPPYRKYSKSEYEMSFERKEGRSLLYT